jgi:hypothetical protein
MTQDEEILIGTIPKGVRTKDETRVSLKRFKGFHLLDIRQFVAGDAADNDELHPTKKGVCIRTARLPLLIELLEKALGEARKRGLFDGNQDRDAA